MEKDIETSFSRGKLLPSSVPSEKLPGKTTTPKKEKKLLVIQQITVKSTLKRTQKTSLSITSPSALPVLNYEELMTKDVWTQTESALSELLDHDGSIRKEELHSWQRVPNPLILWRSPLLPTPLHFTTHNHTPKPTPIPLSFFCCPVSLTEMVIAPHTMCYFTEWNYGSTHAEPWYLSTTAIFRCALH